MRPSPSRTTIVGQPWIAQALGIGPRVPSGPAWKLRQLSWLSATAFLARAMSLSLVTPISQRVSASALLLARSCL
jgi:hypothetical protein